VPEILPSQVKYNDE
jgi:predicted  nucleic acid-binding Zn-ribbon protein